MSMDFKENYIRQQKAQAEARKARLEKIGMGTAVSSTAGNTGKPYSHIDRADAGVRATNTGAVRRSRDAVPQADTKKVSVNEPLKQKTFPLACTPEPEKTAYRTGDAVTQQYTLSEIRATSRFEKAEDEGVKVYTPKKAAASQAAPVFAPKNTDNKPQSAAPAKKAPASPARAASTGSARKTVSYGAAPAHTQRRVSGERSDDHMFKKTLSDEESRAMMFSLTGRAEHPDDGGDVDIINLGMIRPPKKKKDEPEKKKSNVWKYIGRFFITIISLALFLVIAVFSTVGVIAHGPSETLRDLLVNSAMQASATKWVPGLFLSDNEIEAILNKSEETVEDKVSIDDIDSENSTNSEDEWANAKDGMIFETVNRSTFKAYVLLVKDPNRVFVGTSTNNYDTAKYGIDVFQAAERYGSVACINGGEFLDNGGFGTGSRPMGLTYSQGKCVNNDGAKKTFLGFTNENELIVREGMTKAEADELGIRDAVSFQNGNTLIQRDGDSVTVFYQDGNTGTAQRTGIGQRKDGTVILIVTDGRSASSLGATHNDMIDLMLSYGAVSAGLVDGGSSSLMYYEDYYNKYDYDTSTLDKYQLQGLVNNYKAFTEPRKIPTFFMVDPLKEGE